MNRQEKLLVSGTRNAGLAEVLTIQDYSHRKSDNKVFSDHWN